MVGPRGRAVYGPLMAFSSESKVEWATPGRWGDAIERTFALWLAFSRKSHIQSLDGT